MLPSLFFFLKTALTSSSLLWFHTNFRIVFPIFVKNTSGIFIMVALNL